MVTKNIYLLLTRADDYNFKRAKKLLKTLNKQKPDFNKTKIIISGFSSLNPKQKTSEAKSYEKFLKQNQKNLPEIILEEKSVDTLGNMVFTYKIINNLIKKQPNTTLNLFIITELYHMNRVKWLFNQTFKNLDQKLNIKFVSAKTQIFEYIISISLKILLIPFILIVKLASKNNYIKDIILLKILKKDFKNLKLDSTPKIEKYVKSLSVYQNKKTSLDKSIYSKLIDYTKK